MADEERNLDKELQPYLDEALATLRDPNATILDVKHILFGKKQLAAIAKALPGSNIRTLAVGREDANDAALAPLIDALPQSRVTSLEFYGTRMQDASLARLTEVLPKTALRELRVDSYYSQDSDSLRQLMGVLPPSIRKLEFACQNFSNEDAGVLAQLLRTRPLESVEVSRSIMDGEGTSQLLRALPKAARLTSFKLTHAEMTDENTQLLAEALPDTPIEELRLWGCKLSAQGAQELADVLPQSKVKKLDVGSNSGIGKKGTIAIAQALPKTQIRDLRIDQCRSEREGFKALAEALPNSRLESLGLFLSGVDSESAQALAAAFPLSPLRILSLSHNHIGNAGVRALAESLPVSGLEYLDVWQCGAGDDAAKALAESLPKSRLSYLNIKENDQIGLKAIQALAQAIPESQLARLDIYSHKDEAINTEVQTAYRAARQNYKEAMELGRKLTTTPEQMTTQDWQKAAGQTGALHFVVQQEWRMTDDGARLNAQEVTNLLAHSFLRVHETQPEACQKAILNLLPFDQASKTLEQLGMKLEASQLLDETGRVPQDRNLCRGGAKALFSDAGLWQNARQVKQAHASLPEAQKAMVTNLHQLTAAVGTAQRQLHMAR